MMTWGLLGLGLIVLVGQLAIAAGLIGTHRKMPKFDETVPVPGGPRPLVSVILPVRNEQDNLATCLNALLQQSYVPLRIIVVDDHSTDRTPEILRDFQTRHPQLQSLKGLPLPEGWAGKAFACKQGAEAASGEYLLFVDADITLAPDAVAQAVAAATFHRSDLLTVLPHIGCPTFWERVVQPVMLQLILIRFPIELINDASSPVASASGPFMLFKRAAYDQIGGHAALKKVLVDDLTLARRIKQQRLRLWYGLGTRLATLHMYRSFVQLWRGWSLNLFTGLDFNPWIALAAVAAIAVFFVMPPLVLLALAIKGSLVAWTWADGLMAAVWGSVIAAMLMSRRVLKRLFGTTSDGQLWQPLGALIVMAMIVNSAWAGLSGRGLNWRERMYRISKDDMDVASGR
jgi:glycosyltransferase involved in cell wall biosynthesis